MRSKCKSICFLSVVFSLILLLCILHVKPVYADDNALIVSLEAGNSWPGEAGTYYQCEVSITNPASFPVDSWYFVLDLGQDGTYDQSWNCTVTQEESLLTITPASWNARIESSGSVTGIGIVLASQLGDVFSGSYVCDPGTGALTRIEEVNPTLTVTPTPTGSVTPLPTVTSTPVPEGSPTPTPTVTPVQTVTPRPKEKWNTSYPSGTGMYGPLTLQGVNLCTVSGSPVQLRGVSTHGLAWFPQFVNLETFRYLRDEWGVNLIRLAMYTDESGGYCSGGDKAYLENLIDTGVNACTALGLYCIIDWHILADYDPNMNKADALDFFSRMSAKYSSYNNVIYEICNEPHWVDWATIKQYADEVIPVIRANAPDAIIIVGTNTWSQDVLDPASNPVAAPYNVMYALHFYAATHGGWLRDRVVSARNSDVPIFISEFSTCDASGNGAIDYNEAAAWKDLIMDNNLSYAGWNLANKDESSSIVISSCTKLLGWTDDEISDTGKWLRTLSQEGKALEPDIILPDEDLDTLTLPAMLTTIEEEAFQGIQAECVIIPDNVQTIAPRAFAESPNLKKVIVESADVEIAEDAFKGCREIEMVVSPDYL